MAKKVEEDVKKHGKTQFEVMVAQKSGLTKEDTKKAVDAFIASVTEIVTKGDTVIFSGFGKFSVGERAARNGRNPKTGEKIEIPALKSPKFSAGKLLKYAARGK
jgi:DNA-binding protein HU-beta